MCCGIYVRDCCSCWVLCTKPKNDDECNSSDCDVVNCFCSVKSVVDGLSLDGIDSLRIHTATDYISKEHVIRWTELFFVSYGCGSDVDSQPADPAELSRLAEHLAQAFCLAVTPYLEPLAATEMVPVKIGLRVTVGSEQVSMHWFLSCPDICHHFTPRDTVSC